MFLGGDTVDKNSGLEPRALRYYAQGHEVSNVFAEYLRQYHPMLFLKLHTSQAASSTGTDMEIIPITVIPS